MADITRYGATRLIRDPSSQEPAHFATFDLPDALKGYNNVDWFQGQPCNVHIWRVGDRLDKLASQYLSDDEYWWVIALVNHVEYPLSIPIGTELKIPMDVDAVLTLLNLK